ncbi:MAG: hypothetical protein HYY25_08745 [Candidatus Wallbacteria bacterium]|nr:hypothetical protein [Candidatus Wallbacteria bacterium]
MKKVSLAFCVVLAGLTAGLQAAPTAANIAAAHAPVIRHQVSSDKDYLAAFDFDGNWNGYDNWQKQEWGYPLKAVVYYSVLESASHWFVTYLTFHPRRWNTLNSAGWSQENDLQGVQVLVAKDGSPTGKALVLEVWNGKGFDAYQADLAARLKSGRWTGAAGFEGTHPIVTISAKSHTMRVAAPRSAPAKGDVVYRFTGRAEEPKKGAAGCGYALVAVAESFWRNRAAVGSGQTYGTSVDTAHGPAGAALGGDDYRRDAATMPWTWADPKASKVAAGDWFFDPGHSFAQRYETTVPISRAYTANPYAPEQGAGTQLAARVANFEALYGEE